MLEKYEHLSIILQSLGCISQTTMQSFETLEGDILLSLFVVKLFKKIVFLLKLL